MVVLPSEVRLKGVVYVCQSTLFKLYSVLRTATLSVAERVTDTSDRYHLFSPEVPLKDIWV